jgi:hypothetical protein
MAEENFLINPPKRIRRKVKVRRRVKKADPGFYTWSEVKKRRRKLAGVRRRHNPIGETLVTIGANPSRRNPMASNPWFGDSGGHRIAALMRWGKIPRGRVNRHRKRGKVVRRKAVRRTAVRRRRVKRGRWAPFAIRHRRKLAKQAMWVDKYGEMLAHPRRKKYHYKAKGVKFYMARHKKRRKSRKSNTWFGQPRRHRRASKKGWRKGHMVPFTHSRRSRRRRVRHANPMVGATANPRRHRRRHIVKHRRSHGRRKNPFGMGGGMVGKFTGTIMDVRHWAPLAITGGLSAITGAVVPGMLGVSGTWMKYGVQIGVAVGGGMVVERVAGKEHGQAWMIVGMAMVGYSLLKDYVLMPYFPQFAVGLGGYNDYYVDALEDVSQQIGAFPTGMHAFPSMGAYPGVGGDQVGAYPYDGSAY